MNPNSVFWEKIAIRVFVSLGFVGAVIWFFLLPQTKTFSARQNTLNEKQQNLDQRKDKLATLENVKKNWGSTKEIIDRVDKMWPNQDSVSDFIVQVEEMAKKNNVILNSLSITESIVKETKPSVESKEEETADNSAAKKTQAKTETGTKFSFDTSTSYNVLVQIILALENFPRYNSLDALNISQASNTGELNLKISGRIYAK